MPITINGDGSITGLAVGGLPNGCVDADTLAAGAAVPADGSITAAKLASGAITRSALPAGSVIQTVQVITQTQVENAFSSQQTFLTASITPTDNNNKIMVYAPPSDPIASLFSFELSQSKIKLTTLGIHKII